MSTSHEEAAREAILSAQTAMKTDARGSVKKCPSEAFDDMYRAHDAARTDMLQAAAIVERVAGQLERLPRAIYMCHRATALCIEAWHEGRPHEDRRLETRSEAVESLHVAADAFAHYNPELGFSTIQGWVRGIDDRAELDAAIVDLAERSTAGARCPKACSLALVALTRWRLFLDA